MHTKKPATIAHGVSSSIRVKPRPRARSKTIPKVSIEASAGGLDAFEGTADGIASGYREGLRPVLEAPPPVGRRGKKVHHRELAELRSDLVLTRDQEAIELLEAAKDELQSSNEELVALNGELQKRNTQLHQLRDELTNVLAGFDIPMVVLGPDLRIRRFMPQAEKLLPLIPGDIGRPIGQIRIGVNVPDLAELVSQTSQGAHDIRREIQAENGRWYTVWIRPLLTAEQEPDGVLVMFVDVDSLKRRQLRSEREHKFLTAILNAATDLLVVVSDREGNILEMNRAAQEFTGYSLEDLTGRSLWDYLPIPEERTSVRSAFEEALIAGAAHRENHWRTKLGNPRSIAWSATVASNDDKMVDCVICTGVDVTEREEAQEKALRLQEAGNKDLARELHDDLTQKLAALAMEVSTILKPSGKASETLPERVGKLSARVNRMAEDVHAMSRRLHPAILDELGLGAALREECVSFSAQTGISAQFESRGPAAVSGDASLCLYRVAQESLRNIAKHARATNVRVILLSKKDGIALRVEDTGDGFDLHRVKGKGGLGLISMEERVRLVNGKFSVQSTHGKGTTVEVFIPQPKK